MDSTSFQYGVPITEREKKNPLYKDSHILMEINLKLKEQIFCENTCDISRVALKSEK